MGELDPGALEWPAGEGARQGLLETLSGVLRLGDQRSCMAEDEGDPYPRLVTGECLDLRDPHPRGIEPIDMRGGLGEIGDEPGGDDGVVCRVGRIKQPLCVGVCLGVAAGRKRRVLGADQNWAVGGSNASLRLQAGVTGASDTLGATLSNGAELDLFSDDVEVGAVTVSGAGALGFEGNSSLNSSDGNTVSVTGGAEMGMAHAGATGPLSLTGATLQMDSSTVGT